MQILRVGLCAGLSCAVAVASGPPQEDEAVERLKLVAERALDDHELTGLAVGFALAGEPLLLDGWGWSDPAAEEAADEESVMRVGALVAPLIGLGTLMLADEEQLNLEDPLSEHLEGMPEELGAVTLRQLLHHASGLPPAEDVEPEGLDAWIAAQPLEHEPGTCAVYSAANTYLLGRVLESVAGEPVPGFLAARVFAALELEDTRYCERGAPRRATAPSSQQVGGALVDDPLQGDLFGAADLCSTATDLLKWVEALAEGELVSAGGLEELRDPPPLVDGKHVRPVPWAGGFSRQPLDQHEGLVAGGELAGGAVHVAWYPELELTVVLLASAPGGALGRIERSLVRAFLGQPGPELEDLELPEERVDAYVGGYSLGCLSYEVYLRDGHLWLEPLGGRPIHLTWQGEHTFAAESDPELRVTFEVEDDLARALVLDEHGAITVATRME